jgi:hypothetical protein
MCGGDGRRRRTGTHGNDRGNDASYGGNQSHMSTPLWQFWTDWAVKFLGMLATVAAVIVALFGYWLRRRIDPPRLRLEHSSAEGWQGIVYELDTATNKAKYQRGGIWHHVRVQNNKTRWNPVTGVHIFLLKIEAPDASGDFKPIWEGPPAALVWRYETGNLKPKTIGRPEECDFCHVLEDTGELRLSPLIKGQAPDKFTGPFPLKLRLRLQARGVEADSDIYRLEVYWDGKTSDDKTQMSRHLVVKPT